MKREESPLEQESDWNALGEAIVAGLGHEFNGRVTSLLGIAHVARMSGTLERDLLEDLELEAQRLKRAAVLYRRLPFFASSAPRLDRLGDVVRDAILLYRLGGKSEFTLVPVEGNGDVPPVWLPSPTLAKALLLLFSASDTSRPRAAREVRILAAADRTQAISIETTGGDAARQPINAVGALREGREIIESLGGRVVVEESTADSGSHRITITLPAAVAPSPPAEAVRRPAPG